MQPNSSRPARPPSSSPAKSRKPRRQPPVRGSWWRPQLEWLEERTLLSGDYLAITGQPPGTVLTGRPFSLSVQVDTASGQPDPNFAGNVSVAIAPGTGPAGASLGGTATVPVIGTGAAQFSDLRVDLPGSGLAKPSTAYQIQVSAPGLTPVTTAAFDAAAVAITGVQFSKQGVDFSFTVSGAPLPENVPVSLYWSSGPNLSGQKAPLPGGTGANYAWQTIPAGTPPGQNKYTVPAGVLNGSPDNADKDLLVVLGDPLSPGFNQTRNLKALSLDLNVDPVYQSNLSYAANNQQQWPSQPLGHSSTATVSAGGCLLVSLDMALSSAGVHWDPYANVATDPTWLNKQLTASADGYVPKTGFVNLGPATNVVAQLVGQPNLTFHPSNVNTAQGLRDLLTSTGAPVIVKVANPHALTATLTKGSTTVNGLLTLQTLQKGERITGTGIPDGTYVVSINRASNTFVISQAATADNVLASLTYYSTHFVLVTGPDGSTFDINDPGYKGRKTLAQFYNNQFEARG